jgi:N6-L-threonylcarbamoyladenine synthase
MGHTRDDAAGEAFDKVAKMLGLGYPGGGVISKMAECGDGTRIIFPRSYLNKSDFDFSFSGIKTAVKRYIQKHPQEYGAQLPDIASGFQEAVVEVLSYKIIHAAIEKKCDHLAMVGGVAANRRLREQVKSEADQKGLKLHVPSVELCGDNAAMIAAAGYHYLKKGVQSDLSDDVFSRVSVN